MCLYGASNLWLSRRAALAAVRARFEGPLEVGLACGPGRSYGLRAGNALVRYLPLREVEFAGAPHLAVLADAGNDIAYGQRPDVALGWMAELAERLSGQGAAVILTGTPLENLRSIPEWLFVAVRSVLYPGSSLSREAVLACLEELRSGVEQLAAARGHTFLEPDPLWYGLDRIHLHSAWYQRCWEQWLGVRCGQLPSRWGVLRMRPAQCWVLGRERRGPAEHQGVLEEMRVVVR